MYEREGYLYKVFLGLADVLVLSAAFWVAYGVRFGFPAVFSFDHIPTLADSLVTWGISLVSFLLVFRARGLYALRRLGPRFEELANVTAAILIAFLLLIALSYFIREGRYSRLTLAFFGGATLLVLGFGRPRMREAIRTFVQKRVASRRVLILGTGELAQKVADMLGSHPELGIEVVGFVGEPGGALPRPHLGSYEDAPEVVHSARVDEVIYAVPLEEHSRLPELLDLVANEPVVIKVVPDLYRYVTLCAGVEEFAGLPIIRLQGTPMNGADRFLKRSFDAVGSFLLLVLSSPLLLVLALAVWLTSRGPILYRQERMGLDGHLFSMLKFRTMRQDAEADTGEVWAARQDPRCTRVGSFLRRFSFDELPQLFNVLRGDMSLVGPRPERPKFIEEFRERIPHYHLRHMVKAGITGWAQVNGWRGATSLEKRLEYDLYYIEHWSFSFDLKILLRTVAGGFFDRGAQRSR